eukprot:495737_1
MIVQSDIQMLYDYEVNDSVPIQTPYHPKLYRLSGHMLFKKATEYYKHLHALGIADEVVRAKEGFNAGIYLYDLHFWRNNNLTKKYEYYVKLNHEYDGQLWLLGTQPIVNLLYVHQNIERISNKWNVRDLGHEPYLFVHTLKSGYIYCIGMANTNRG